MTLDEKIGGDNMPWPVTAPDPEILPEEDRKEFDFVNQRVLKLTGIPGRDLPYVSACLNAPTFAAALWRFSGRMLAASDTREKTFTNRDREYSNVVYALELGSYVMFDYHFDYAVDVVGVRPEMIKAIWNGRDEDLNDEERQLVDYIRGFVNGTVTEEMWDGIVERFGSERGAVEYTMAIGYNFLCARSMQAYGVPAISREEMDRQVQNLRVGDSEARSSKTAPEGGAIAGRDPALLAEMGSV